MVRLTGILIGSVLAVAFLIIALGVPQLASETLIEPVAEARTVVAESHTPVADMMPAVQPNTPLPTQTGSEWEQVTDDDASPSEIPRDAAPYTQTKAESEPDPLLEVATDPAVIEQSWYAFWSPFRSRIAAEGFVAELQRTTGLDYRVVKLKPGVYEVAFAYTSDSDIADKLTQISAATGLDMSGG